MLSRYHKHENSRWISKVETLLFAEQKLFPFCETNQGAASKDWTKALLYESELASAAVCSLHQNLLFGEREEEWWWAVINWWRMAEGWPWNRWSCLQTIFPPQLKSRWWWDFEMQQKHTILRKEKTSMFLGFEIGDPWEALLMFTFKVWRRKLWIPNLCSTFYVHL